MVSLSGPMRPSMPTCADGPDPMAQAVALVFRTFTRAFGARWAAQGSDPKSLAVWERKLAKAGITPEQVRAAIDRKSVV